MSGNPDWSLKAKNIVNEFIKSKKNSNCLLELEELLLSNNEECTLSMFPIVLDLFTEVFSRGLLNASSCNDQNQNAYRSWLLDRYGEFIEHLLTYLSHDNSKIQISALQTLLSLVKMEGDFPRKNEKENPHFPFDLFKKIVSALASDVLNQHHLIKVFQEYTQYYDVKLYLLKSVMELLEPNSRECETEDTNIRKNETREISELFLQNCFFLLYSMKYPKWSGEAKSETFAYRSDPEQPFELKEKVFSKLFSSVWKCLLSYEFSSVFLQKALPAFNENILPHLRNPCLMTDFLTNAYNKGGVLSLLALKGLFFLMDKCNLEYPDFFVKLYALLDQTIMNGKFSSVFFELTDLFLSSTHLPAHIVAAFSKKLSRLSLKSSTDTILKVLCLVSNLLLNHPSLGVLIHRTDGTTYNEDPFSFDAVDPAKSNAIESSLWEVKTLQSHVNPTVSIKARELTDSYPKISSSIYDISETSLQDLYRKSRKRKLDDIPLAVHRPTLKRKSSD